jgi:hypothetical protein
MPPTPPALAAAKTQGRGGQDQARRTGDLPFDFRYSYSETDPAWKPIGFREPTRFSPFGPGRLDRPWDGVAAAARGGGGDAGVGGVGAMSREEALGEPLSEATLAELVERYRHSDCSRQINLGEFVVFFIPKCRLFLPQYARDCETYYHRNWLSEWRRARGRGGRRPRRCHSDKSDILCDPRSSLVFLHGGGR